MRVLYAFIGNHPTYNGLIDGDVKGGGGFKGVKGEIHNFSCYDSGYFGYVEPSSHRTITVNDNFPETYVDECGGYSDDVLVVWLAQCISGDREIPGKHVIVGWYEHARVYRCQQTVPDDIKALRPAYGIAEPVFHLYNIRARDAVRIPENERSFIVSYGERQRYVIAKGKLPDDEILQYIKDYSEGFSERIEHIEQPQLTGEEREVIAKARVNQDKFRTALLNKYGRCAVKPCGVTFDKALAASHIIPWRNASAADRLCVCNGLLLCKNHDSLFDQGYITFDDDGSMIISPLIDEQNRIFLNISERSRIDLTDDMKSFMKYHREHVFRGTDDK